MSKPSSIRVKRSVEKAIRWAWNARLSGSKWSGSVILPTPGVTDTAEIMTALAAASNAGFNVDHRKFQQSMKFLRSSISNLKDEDSRAEEAKILVWMLRLFTETHEPTGSQDFHSLLDRLNLFRVQGEGWGNIQGGLSGVFNTSLVIPCLNQLKKLEEARNEASLWLAKVQNADGGWGWYRGYLSDPVSTALALLAVKSVEGNSERLLKAQRWLLADCVRRGDEAFWLPTVEQGQKIGTGASTYTHFSTAYCVEALLAMGKNNASIVNGAVNYLLKLQHDTGGWSFARGLDWFKCDMSPLPWCTANAILALVRFLKSYSSDSTVR